MFRTISWGQFFTTIIILVVIYYLVIAGVYFRHDLLLLVQRKGTVPPEPLEPSGEKKMDHFIASSDLKKALQQVFNQGSEKGWIKQELLMAIGMAVKHFPDLKGTAFQSAINNYISIQASTQCKVELNEHELQQIWLA